MLKHSPRRYPRLPHWEAMGITHFLTFRLLTNKLRIPEIRLVRDAVRSGDRRFYQLFAVVVMPDHCHILIRPLEKVILSRIVKGIKGVTARRINLRRGKRSSLWQKNYFDQAVRSEKHFRQCLKYMLDNPRKAGLISDPWEWPGLYVNSGVG